MPDAGRARGHEFGLLFFKFEKTEIIAAIFLFFGASERFFGNAKKRKTWRKGERFLCPGEHDVNAERVHRDRECGERRDGVKDEGDVGILGKGATNLG